MRRRIYVNPEGDLEDHTNKIYLYDPTEGPWDEPEWCRTGAFYDDALWAEYHAACEEVSRLRGRVLEKLRFEPLDEVELRISARYRELMDREDSARDEWVERDALVDEALAHAATLSGLVQ